MSSNNNGSRQQLLHRLRFREVLPTDIPRIFEIESLSYPDDEQASKSTLQYRQHHAAPYFRCAVLLPESSSEAASDHQNHHNDHDDALLIGYICSTRCHEFTHDSFTTHVSGGSILAIHSVAVHPDMRRCGVATSLLKEYIQEVQALNSEQTIDRISLLAKQSLLTFYINAGFSVVRPSPIVHGQDQWFECEHVLPSIPCFHVNAFRTATLAGNPAAVVILPPEKDLDHAYEQKHEWMQKVAAQFNLSETAFVIPSIHSTTTDNDAPSPKNLFGIRYYTPTTPIPLCGHATLASASVLLQTNACLPEERIVFQASGGRELVCIGTHTNQVRCTAVSMDFPSQPPTAIEAEEVITAVQNMILSAANVKSDDIRFLGLVEALGDVFIEIAPEAFYSLTAIRYAAFLEWDGYSRGVIVCCRATPPDSGSGDGVDFLSRFFAPKSGIDEDPVTGSAHCALAPYFASEGKEKLVGKQLSPRGGVVECQLIENSSKVRLTGSAATVMKGSLYL